MRGFSRFCVYYVSMMKEKKELPVVVAVSGGFDPLHIGHVRYFQEAKKLGDELVVILNNDNWLRKKKRHVFMFQEERKEILEALSCIDRVVLTAHTPDTKDMSVCSVLEMLRPNIFANGGDRTFENIPEVAVCNQLQCEMVFNVGRGGKIQSSSWLLATHAEAAQKISQSKTLPEFSPRPEQVDYTNIRWVPVINCIVTHKDRILLVQRSKDLNFYPGYWNGISGFLDDNCSLEEKAREELAEELGLSADTIVSVLPGDIFEQEAPEYKKTWIVHPALVKVNTDRVTVNWEAEAYRWLTLRETENLNLLPGVRVVLQKLFPDYHAE